MAVHYHKGIRSDWVQRSDWFQSTKSGPRSILTRIFMYLLFRHSGLASFYTLIFIVSSRRRKRYREKKREKKKRGGGAKLKSSGPN